MGRDDYTTRLVEKTPKRRQLKAAASFVDRDDEISQAGKWVSG
jgi:hypothetical protein